MARRKRKINNYNNYQIVNNKLYLNKNLESILNRILDMRYDPIADRLINDSKKPNVPLSISWLNITVSNDHMSYTTPDKVKNNGDEWLKENRKCIQIRKLIRKMYKKTFSNNQIRSFSTKFKKIYSEFIKENKRIKNNNYVKNKPNINTDIILNNIIDETTKGELDWVKSFDNDFYTKYKTKIFITEKKYLSIEIYKSNNGGEDFISIFMYNGDSHKKHILRSNDSDVVWFIKEYIEENV